jgi:DNA-binding phage protein
MQGSRLKTKKFDVADYLSGERMIAVHLKAAIDSHDVPRIAESLDEARRARRQIYFGASTRL